MDDREEKESGIKVTDRRRFDEQGDKRQGAEEKPPVAETKGSAEASPASEPQARGTSEAGFKPPPLDFSTFLLSLAASAQVHLGVLENPAIGKEDANLPLAKETIDLIGLLEEKTKGNLTSDEERLFEHVLYDLRMIYVERSKKGT